MHEFVVLMVESRYALLDGEADLHSSVAIIAKFCVNNTEQFLIDNNRCGLAPICGLLQGVFCYDVAFLGKKWCSPNW
jgi:hypothetical protein